MLYDVLRIVHNKLEKTNIQWALCGSTNMKLQGMNTNPRDLDIVVHYNDLQKISEIFSNYSSSDVRKLDGLTTQPAWEVVANINDIEIQFFGGHDDDIYTSKLLSNKIKYVKLDDIDIPCFDLDTESQCYKETNREKKANLIKEFLKNQEK